MNGAVPTAIVLAAGKSSRMGTPKALLPIGGLPLVVAHLRALAPFFRDLRVVVGCDAQRIVEVLPGSVTVIYNLDWAWQEMIDSAKKGVEGVGCAALTPVDTPPAAAATLQALLRHGGACVPRNERGEGHPVVLGPQEVAKLASGEVRTLRELMADAPRVMVADPWLTRNFNTPAEWEAYRSGVDNP